MPESLPASESGGGDEVTSNPEFAESIGFGEESSETSGSMIRGGHHRSTKKTTKHVTLSYKNRRSKFPKASQTELSAAASATDSKTRLQKAHEEGLKDKMVDMEVYGRYKPKLKNGNKISWWSMYRKPAQLNEVSNKRLHSGGRPKKDHWPAKALHRMHNSKGQIGTVVRDITMKVRPKPPVSSRNLQLHDKQSKNKKGFTEGNIEHTISALADIDPTARVFCGRTNTSSRLPNDDGSEDNPLTSESDSSMVPQSGSGVTVVPSGVQAQYKMEKKRLKKVSPQDEAMMLNEKTTARQMRYLLAHTHFEDHEIRALQELFHALTDQTDEMDRHLFAEVAQVLLGLETKIFGEQMFRFFDYCHDGSIGSADWVRGVSVLFRGDLEEHIRYCFQIYDCRGEGVITREDVRNLLRGCLRYVPGMDENEDAFDPTNIRDIAEAVMKRMEEDRKGYITYRSFARAVNNDPLQLQCLGDCLPNPEIVRTTLALIMDDYTLFETNYSVKFSVHAHNSHWKYLKSAIMMAPAAMKTLARGPVDTYMVTGRYGGKNNKRPRRKSINPSLRYILYGI